MQAFRTTHKKCTEQITVLLLLLFGLHVLSIHGFADALVLCFEDNGEVNIESEAGSLFSIPSEEVVHAEAHQHKNPTFDASGDHHSDVALSVICSKEQQVTRFDQSKIFAFLEDIATTSIEILPRSRVFQLASFIPPLIEDLLITNLQTVVLLN
ncbi:hypothetical protein [Fodinibius salsisoli]|uniref:DUF2796 domain-containing protein n=1 Tax=Fodinibius salsisoli TaxID=2820877 RepID=A0ABT3PL81_9BACT|nr:hypothetical protein [Fodinibius salsisoli]MCW9706687.1 hypothetical protein [Fodinibius salsisoli]